MNLGKSEKCVYRKEEKKIKINKMMKTPWPLSIYEINSLFQVNSFVIKKQQKKKILSAINNKYFTKVTLIPENMCLRD